MVSRIGLAQYLNIFLSCHPEVGGLSLHGHKMVADALCTMFAFKTGRGRRDLTKKTNICPFLSGEP